MVGRRACGRGRRRTGASASAIFDSAATATAVEEDTGEGKCAEEAVYSRPLRGSTPLGLPPADAGGENEAPEENGDDEVMCSIMRRTKEQKWKRRLEEAASAVAASPVAAEWPGSEGNFVREASKKSEGIHDPRIDQDKIPDLKRKKKVDANDLEKERIDKLRSIEGKMSNKVGKQHDMKKMLPLHSILKKYTKHTSFKMVKEKKVDDVLGIDKQTSKRPQLESICKLFSDALASSSSSSTDMSTEGDRYVAAESSSSHMPELMEASKNMDHEDSLELVSTKLPSNLIDLNEALPESTDFNYPSVSNSEPDPEPTQHTILERVENSVSSGTLLQNEFKPTGSPLVSDLFAIPSNREG
ncbi:hypothetical protein GUJ93_ZPchr0008g14017 [Zizania palustris]|uniref:Uncharacterized protein n=1 Tax=Zizania palustris TaxID=103762 RepID=A0A8J5QX57_ZIZPA|nr:hypothetical protein GUJ93_ZPchr0008g14017 [Zizania palustris]